MWRRRGDRGGARRQPGRRLPLHLTALPLVLVALAAITLRSCPAQASTLPPHAPKSRPGKIYAPQDIISMPWVYTTTRLDYLYQSGLGRPYVPLRTFTTLGKGLSAASDAMPTLPPWVSLKGATGPIWSPSVFRADGHYVMWFTANWKNPHPVHGETYLRCLGNAVASSPRGPFTNPGARRPAFCQVAQSGDIDPRPTKINGRWRLYWKSNNNVARGFTHTTIWTARLSPNGMRLGAPVALFESSRAWQDKIIEAPQMVPAQGHYYLFYSGNGANSPDAGIGVAICSSPISGCRPLQAGPFLGSDALGNGPSEESLFKQNGATWLLYTPHATYAPNLFPELAVSRVAFGPAGPYVATFDGAVPGT